MSTILIATLAFGLYILAYQTYGKFLAKKIFSLSDDQPTAAVTLEDGHDFVPTKSEILFGHHYTSIAGTGPIVGPALAIIWGWVPALLWVVFGAIFMGAVHDFGSVVISMRNRGRSIGDLAGDVLSPRVRYLFLLVVAITVLIVIAIFCLVIAKIFHIYPQSVIPIWSEIPIAMALGYGIYRKKWPPLASSLVALALMYITIVIGAYFPITMPTIFGVSPVVSWSIILLIYAYIASIIPVWRLLQPRDYINGHELFVAMGLLALGVIFSRPEMVAPALNLSPAGAPPIFPFLFILIACGAVSGFHCLVGSGTTSKQISLETDAKKIGYGAMLAEGLLAVFVIIAVGAGLGLGENADGLTGSALWNAHYANFGAAEGLGPKLSAFVDGSAEMLKYIGMPLNVALAIMGVFIASFAATTLDSATRIQRYVISELAQATGNKKFGGKYIATAIAIITAGILALHDGKGAGGLILWPLFGATNQLLACLALLTITAYLKRKGKPVIYTLLPAIIMFIITATAMYHNLVKFTNQGSYHLLIITALVIILEIWLIVETTLVLTGKDNHKAEIR